MRKLDGLRFLQENFPRLTVDCLFVDKLENLTEENLYARDCIEQLWRVRGGKKIGSELNLPQGTFRTTEELRNFIRQQNGLCSNMEYVIHRVSPEYFAAPFVGTIAVHNNKHQPSMTIELQRVTKELVASIDKGKRPRDWEACLILEHELMHRFPKIRKNDGVNLEAIKHSIMVIHEVGQQIFEIYDRKGEDIDTYTRFNIYNLGQVVLDDHRSSDSFTDKYRCTNLPKITNNIPNRQQPRKTENIER